MSWVDYDRDHVWTYAELEARARAHLAGEFPDAPHLMVRAAQLAAGNGYMSADERTRWDAYAARKSALDVQVGTEWIRMGWLSAAMAVEAAQRALQALPAPPTPPAPDPDADKRLELQAEINGAAPEVSLIVAERNRVPPPQKEEEAQP